MLRRASRVPRPAAPRAGWPKPLSRRKAPCGSGEAVSSVLIPRREAVAARPARLRRPPVFLMAQTECLTCGREIEDPLRLEEWGRFCSARCYHGHGLPVLRRQGA